MKKAPVRFGVPPSGSTAPNQPTASTDRGCGEALPQHARTFENFRFFRWLQVHQFAALALFTFSLTLLSFPSRAWDYEGHRLVNQLALGSLPANFPSFVQAPVARERIAFLAGEPDRWRNTPDLSHLNAPDHFIDLDDLEPYGIDPHSLTPFRYDFVAALALGRQAHPDKFPPIDPEQNRDHTRQLVGFLPWAIMENFDKLKSGFSYLKAFQEHGGTPEEIANAQENIIYIMGVMGHYVGDGSQPLHTTRHYNGWVGDNPEHYTTAKIHSRVDGYFREIDPADWKEIQSRIHPAQLVSAGAGEGKPHDTFSLIVAYILDQQQQVVPLYKLEKDGKLFAKGDQGKEGRTFLTSQLLKGGQMLGNIWYTAWQEAGADTYLSGQLERRKLAAGDESAKTVPAK